MNDTAKKPGAGQDTAGRRDEALVRRGDNVGQSGRWRRDDERTDGERRYGNEESHHSTEQAQDHTPEEPEHRDSNPDKPRAGSYAVRSAAPGEDGEDGYGETHARHRDKAYADAGGAQGENLPKHPGKRWTDQGGAGHGEKYGEGRDPNPARKR